MRVSLPLCSVQLANIMEYGYLLYFMCQKGLDFKYVLEEEFFYETSA